MQAKELMIGDWVNVLWGHSLMPTKVNKLEACGSVWIEPLTPDGSVAIQCDVSPIPLTVDFLKLNNFIQDNHNWYRYGDIEVYPATNKGSFCDLDHPIVVIQRYGQTQELHLRCDYIHTFQHILRLHGYEELANNLKIE